MEKTRYDVQLFSDLTDEKFLKVLTMMNNCDFMGYFSGEAQELFNDIKDNDFKINRNGVEVDLKERIENFSSYVESKRVKYFGLLNGFFAFEEVAKRESLGAILEENSFMVDEDQESIMNPGAGNNNITSIVNNNNNAKRNNTRVNARNSSIANANDGRILDEIDEEGEKETEINNFNKDNGNPKRLSDNIPAIKDNRMKEKIKSGTYLFIYLLICFCLL